MPWSLLGDLTALTHLGFVAFVPTGGWLALRRPGALVAHVPAVVWAAGIATAGWTCPLTSLENAMRQRAGREAHELGFIDAYLTGVVYPERWLHLLQALVATSVVASYVVLAARHRRRARRQALAPV